MASSKSGLGKGFGALIPADFDADALLGVKEQVEEINLERLMPNPDQPRTIFDTQQLSELAESIKRHGIVQPLVVNKSGEKYLIIAGERRWRAAKLAGLKTAPAIVRTLRQQEQLEIALVENVQRVDLGPLEQAISIERLHQQFNLAYADIAKRLGKAETTISNLVRLLGLPAKARLALNEQKISEGHARQILALKGSADKQDELLKLIVSQHWNVRQAERYVTSIKAGVKEASAVRSRLESETPQTKHLGKLYNVPVKIYRTAKGGRIEMHFTSDEDLQRLLTQLDSPKN